MNYEVGGKIMVSGMWYDIAFVDEDSTFYPVAIECDEPDCVDWIRKEFIIGYLPPEKKEWISGDEWDYFPNSMTLEQFNSFLEDKYGEPK